MLRPRSHQSEARNSASEELPPLRRQGTNSTKDCQSFVASFHSKTQIALLRRGSSSSSSRRPRALQNVGNSHEESRRVASSEVRSRSAVLAMNHLEGAFKSLFVAWCRTAGFSAFAQPHMLHQGILGTPHPPERPLPTHAGAILPCALQQ